MTKPVLNLDEVAIQTVDPAKAPQGATAARYDLRKGAIASRIGARKLGYNLTVVAPGKRSCPFHSHRVEEEMFFILQGRGELRFGDARYPLRTGDVVACPVGGPETAHQIINTGDTEMRYLSVSTQSEAEICEYPDSGKYGVFAPGDTTGASAAPFRRLAHFGESVDYWEGE